MSEFSGIFDARNLCLPNRRPVKAGEMCPRAWRRVTVKRRVRKGGVRIKFAVRFVTDRSWRTVILRSVGAACINKERGQKILFLDTCGACASRNGRSSLKKKGIKKR